LSNPISVSFAKRLEYALGVDSSFWINLQANYDKELGDLEEGKKISDEELEILPMAVADKVDPYILDSRK